MMQVKLEANFTYSISRFCIILVYLFYQFKNWLTFGQYYHFPLGKNSVEIMLKLYTDYYVQVQFTKHLYSVQKLQHRLT